MPDLPSSSDAEVTWYVYLLVSDPTGRTYAGISTAPERRLEQHNGLRAGGAKATRSGRPWSIARLHGPFMSKGEALRVEYALKRLRGQSRFQFKLDQPMMPDPPPGI